MYEHQLRSHSLNKVQFTYFQQACVSSPFTCPDSGELSDRRKGGPFQHLLSLPFMTSKMKIIFVTMHPGESFINERKSRLSPHWARSPRARTAPIFRATIPPIAGWKRDSIRSRERSLDRLRNLKNPISILSRSHGVRYTQPPPGLPGLLKTSPPRIGVGCIQPPPDISSLRGVHSSSPGATGSDISDLRRASPVS